MDQSLRRPGESVVMISKSCALDRLGAECVRDVKPGEPVVVDGRGTTSIAAENSTRQSKRVLEFICGCSRPENIEIGLIGNHSAGKPSVEPQQSVRCGDARVKRRPVNGVLEEKRVVVVDDSIVGGSTRGKLVTLSRKAGAEEIHLLIGIPPFKFPCCYGTGIPGRSEFSASTQAVEECRERPDADSLEYLAMGGLRFVVEDPEGVCSACSDGEYAIPLSIGHRKSVREDGAVPL